jgi:hypothetical protein
MIRKNTLFLVVALALAVASPVVPVSAGTVIDFTTGTAGPGGLITVNPDTNVVGSGILIGRMIVNATSAYNADGILSFSTGGTSGNYFRIDGTVSVGTSVIEGELLSGTISAFSPFPCCTDEPVLFTASGSDTKNSSLLLALGVDPDISWDFFGLSVQLPGWVLGQTSSVVVKSGVRNTSVTPVPEASSLLLLGSTLAGLGFLVRRYWAELPRN